MTDDDPELRAAFQALRENDVTNAPPFERTVARRAPPPSRLVVVLPLAGVLAAAAVVVLWIAGRAPHRERAAAAAPVATSDPEPLAFLMDPCVEPQGLPGGP